MKMKIFFPFLNMPYSLLSHLLSPTFPIPCPPSFPASPAHLSYRTCAVIVSRLHCSSSPSGSRHRSCSQTDQMPPGVDSQNVGAPADVALSATGYPVEGRDYFHRQHRLGASAALPPLQAHSITGWTRLPASATNNNHHHSLPPPSTHNRTILHSNSRQQQQFYPFPPLL